MKTFKIPFIAILFVFMLSSCGPQGRSNSPTQITDLDRAGTVVAMTMQFKLTPTQAVVILPTHIAPTVTASPLPTQFPPNTPVWSAYNYTCEFTAGGGNMTMNLAWNDRSDSEEGYNVYRNKQLIATLAPDSTFYADVAFVASGNTLSYTVEAFNAAWLASTSTITYGCQ